MLKPNKKFLLYAIPFLLIFNFYFLPGLTDGHQTTVVFILTSFIQMGLTFLVFRLLLFILKKELPGWAYGLTLYLLSECVIFVISGEVSLFGVSYKLRLNAAATDKDILVFREQRCFAFSMSFLISAAVCSIAPILNFREKSAT